MVPALDLPSEPSKTQTPQTIKKKKKKKGKTKESARVNIGEEVDDE